jgi:TonB-linked SusC/RagA family outer membrane protein
MPGEKQNTIKHYIDINNSPKMKNLMKQFMKKRLRMKIATAIWICSIFFCLQVQANVLSPVIPIRAEMKDVPIRKVFSEIEAISKVRFFYNDELSGLDRKISISLNNNTLDEILKQVLQNTQLTYKEMSDNFIVITPLLKDAQTESKTAQSGKTVSGTVSDPQGEPVIGATIVEKGAKNGTVSDTDGKFKLNVSSGATLLVSYLGYKTQEIAAGNSKELTIILVEDSKLLNEVVVVGFGTQKKVNLTGAVGTVSAEDLQNRPVQNVTQALQGLVPGLNIEQTDGLLNSNPTVNIRGTGTIGTGSSGSPLVLIDGVQGDLSLLNPQDIENISVLKDAAASSIYGSRAPFGVILITTKKGSSDKVHVNYSNNFRWASPIVRPKTMDSYTFATWVNDYHINSNSNLYFGEEIFQRIKDYRDGVITTVNIPSTSGNTDQWAGMNERNANTDFYDIFYKDRAYSQEHNVNASGGNERFNFYVGIGYLGKSGLLKVADDIYRRLTPTATIEAQMTDWMKLRYTTRFIRTEYEKPTCLNDNYYINGSRARSWPNLPYYDDYGNIMDSNALWLKEGGRSNRKVDAFNNHASWVIEPVKNWITTAEFNYNVSISDETNTKHQIYVHDIYGNQTIAAPDIIGNSAGSWVYNFLWKAYFLNINVYSSYQHTLNDVHHFKVMVGGQMEDSQYRTYSMTRFGVITEKLPVIDLTTGLGADGSAVAPSVDGRSGEWSTAGFFGRLNYDYKERYLLEANLRYDGTSRFRDDKRWGLFPSVSAGWNIARESFWEGWSKAVNVLKLRGSYGKLGNQNTTDYYPTYQIFNLSGNPKGTWLQDGTKTNTTSSPALISTALTWEQVSSVNGGVDAAALNNRFTVSFDYFVRKTMNMVGPAPELPDVLGKTVPRTNNTDLKTSGFELELAWQDRLKNGLQYSIRALLSDYRSVVTRYPNDQKLLNISSMTGNSSTYYSGMNLGEIWGYETIGIAKTDDEMLDHLANASQNTLGSNWAAGDIMYRDLNGDKTINTGANTADDPGDMKIIGNNTPRYLFGLDMSAAWKGFDLRVFFNGVGKRDYWNGTATFFGVFRDHPNASALWDMYPLVEHQDYFRDASTWSVQQGIQPENTDAYYARPLLMTNYKNQRPQTRYLQDASYIRLKNLTVGYTLPQSLTKNLFISRCRLFVTGENLWTGTKLATMLEPESVIGSTSNSTSTHPGGAYYPLEKVFSAGLTLTFK